jgi:hypothetical protein
VYNKYTLDVPYHSNIDHFLVKYIGGTWFIVSFFLFAGCWGHGAQVPSKEAPGKAISEISARERAWGEGDKKNRSP